MKHFKFPLPFQNALQFGIANTKPACHILYKSVKRSCIKSQVQNENVTHTKTTNNWLCSSQT